MVILIDSAEIANRFIEEFSSNESIIIPIASDPLKHSMDNRLSLLYVYLLDGQEYLLFLNHSETIFNSDNIISELKSDKRKFCSDKKVFNHLLDFDNVFDLNLVEYLHDNKAMNLEDMLTNCHRTYYNKYYKFNNINDFIPALKHLEYCSKIKDKLLGTLDRGIPECYSDYDRMLENYAKIEENGLFVHKEKFLSNFGINHKRHISKENLVFTEYNYNTITGRPSNRFGGINYSALNKDDDTRTIFASRQEGVILEYDFDAYHMRLISDLIGYKLGPTSVHGYLAKKYFNKDDISLKEYDESKAISFRVLYGGIPKEFENIEFFKLTKQFIFSLWNKYNKLGFIETPLYKRKLKKKNLGDLIPQKLFNYYIQAYETEANFDMIEMINDRLNGLNTKLILNTYDSFTLDFDLKDGKDLIFDIKEKLKYPTKIKWGTDYKNLKSLEYQVLA